MRPQLIVMLTYNDQTVENAQDVFMSCKDLSVKNWGFKDIGLPKERMVELVNTMKKYDKTTFLEVVSYTEEECLSGAKIAVDCGFDYLMGTTYYDSVDKLLDNTGVKYFPFCGEVSGNPSILKGNIQGIIDKARYIEKKGISGFDILAYRYTDGDPEILAEEFITAMHVPVVVAGSISSFERIDKIKDLDPWGFTIGSAFFDKKFMKKGDFKAQLSAVIEYMDSI